jgi:hypothetical protein
MCSKRSSNTKAVNEQDDAKHEGVACYFPFHEVLVHRRVQSAKLSYMFHGVREYAALPDTTVPQPYIERICNNITVLHISNRDILYDVD